MEVLKLQKAITRARWAVAVIAAISVAITFTACSKSNNGATPTVGLVGGYGAPGCTACTFPAAALTTANGVTGDGVQLAVTLYGNASQTTTYNSMVDPQAQLLIAYNGPVAMQGTLTITNPAPACGVAPGTYQVSTITPGTFSNSQFMGLVVQATGGNSGQTLQLAFGLTQVNALYSSNNTAFELQEGPIQVETVNNMACGATTQILQ